MERKNRGFSDGGKISSKAEKRVKEKKIKKIMGQLMWVWHCQMLKIPKNKEFLVENIRETDKLKICNKSWTQWMPLLCW